MNLKSPQRLLDVAWRPSKLRVGNVLLGSLPAYGPGFQRRCLEAQRVAQRTASGVVVDHGSGRSRRSWRRVVRTGTADHPLSDPDRAAARPLFSRPPARGVGLSAGDPNRTSEDNAPRSGIPTARAGVIFYLESSMGRGDKPLLRKGFRRTLCHGFTRHEIFSSCLYQTATAGRPPCGAVDDLSISRSAGEALRPPARASVIFYLKSSIQNVDRVPSLEVSRRLSVTPFPTPVPFSHGFNGFACRGR